MDESEPESPADNEVVRLVDEAARIGDEAIVALDELVHDAFGHRAAAVNNGSAEDQIRFLLAEEYSAEDILDAMGGKH